MELGRLLPTGTRAPQQPGLPVMPRLRDGVRLPTQDGGVLAEGSLRSVVPQSPVSGCRHEGGLQDMYLKPH